MCGSLRGGCCVMWGWGGWQGGTYTYVNLCSLAVFPMMLPEGTCHQTLALQHLNNTVDAVEQLWGSFDLRVHRPASPTHYPSSNPANISYWTGISGKAAYVCVSKTNRRQVSALLSGVTREHESGSKEHMFGVPLMPGLWADSVWVWVGISKCSLG